MNLNIEKTNRPELRITEDSYITMHLFMIADMKLNHAESIVFAIIYGFFTNGLTYCGSRKYLADWACCGLTTIDKAISSLVKKGYIRKIGRYNNRIEYTVRIENLPATPAHERMIELANAEKAAAR